MNRETDLKTITEWEKIIESLGEDFAGRAQKYDREDEFVEKNYQKLKAQHFFSAMVPEELGGGGLRHSEMCDLLKTIARYCSSTALAASMHQHLIASNVWKYKHGKGGEKILKKVAEEELVLISTGASDWIYSSGKLDKTDGGYLMTGRKVFCSQAPAGEMLATTSVYDHPEKGPTVLHFPLSKNADGVNVLEDWKAMGMRATGSHTIDIKEAFIPEESVVLERPQGEYHMVWNVALTVALPLIMAVYVGIAEAASEKAIQMAGKKKTEHRIQFLTGEMNNLLITAQMAFKEMVAIVNNFDFEATDENGSAILTRKTIAINAAVKAVEKAMELAGGAGFFRKKSLERLFRDVQAGKYHPLPEKKQQSFSGRLMLGLAPINNKKD